MFAETKPTKPKLGPRGGLQTTYNSLGIEENHNLQWDIKVVEKYELGMSPIIGHCP